MTYETCKTCGKRVILTSMSHSEVRRACFMWDLCICPDNNSPGDIKMIVNFMKRDRSKD